VAVNPILVISGLSCRLGGRAVLRRIDVTVAEGETVVLLGRSGSGKTTLLKCVNGMAAATEGEVRFQGRPAAAWDPIRMRRQMGYVIQEGGLFPHWTVAENVGLVPRLEGRPEEAIAQRVDELLASVGLPAREFRRRYPRQLSGGQRQRVGIARALAGDPPLLLLDEPFASLDPITRFDLQRQFLELRRKFRKTALFVTHDVREALMLASRIVLLREGSVELAATPEEFVAAGNAEARAFLDSLRDPGMGNGEGGMGKGEQP
jgi:osmoprotectant transport system ATP-binding protein